MERQMKKCRQTEGLSKVNVLYYLCRNHHLEHPHFVEVPLSSPEGLYLRDVIGRLNCVRGRGMPDMYTWSCKRSYKNGFVWHDLCQDDLILPARGNEYILKGSEIFQDPHLGIVHPTSSANLGTLNQLQGPTGIVKKETKPPPEVSHQGIGPSTMSPQSSVRIDLPKCPSKSFREYNISNGIRAIDASTQTEEFVGQPKPREPCKGDQPNQTSQAKENSEVSGNVICPPMSPSNASSGRRSGTLESLLRADSTNMNSFRMIDEGTKDAPSNPNQNPVNVLLQLVSCGSFSMNDHTLGFVPNYRPRLSSSKLPSGLDFGSAILGNSDLMGLTTEDKEYSGSLTETQTQNSEHGRRSALKRSSSYNADRNTELLIPNGENANETASTRLKCIPRSIQVSMSRQLRRETMKSHASQRRRNSSAEADVSQTIPVTLSNYSVKRTNLTSSVSISPKRQDFFKEEEEVFKIEERISSGARVIIKSKRRPLILSKYE